jgi:hypothetical protein
MVAAMAPEGSRRKSSILLTLVLLAPAALSVWWLATRSEHTASSFDDALDRALAPVMQQREVQAKLSAATSTQARLLAREVAKRSVQYLDPRDLELWAATRGRVASVSKPACAHLWKGGDDTFLGPAIAALGDETLDAYVEMLARGLALRLEKKPPPAVSVAALDRGFAAIAEQLPAETRARFEADVKRRDVTDERACELFRMLSLGAEKLSPPLRVDFYRALASALEVRQ